MPSTRNLGSRQSSAGFTLIEVLIAVVVLSIGLLGVAALQITAKRGNNEAMQRATAVMLTEDVLDRIRNNLDEGGNYAVTLQPTSAPTVRTTCSDCTDAQKVEYDLYLWHQSLLGASEGVNQGGLAQPTGCITPPGAGGNGVYTVAIAWRGLTEISAPTLSACGQGAADYESVAGSGDDLYRRVITVTAYIAE